MHENPGQHIDARMSARRWCLALLWLAMLALVAAAAAVTVVAAYRSGAIGDG
jgi:hypothetical protein